MRREPDVLHVDPVADAAVLRALAHPLRISMLGALRRGGPATASQLAGELGESSGLTSYHLRVLAEHGLIVDEPSRGSGRERYWRAAHRSTVFTTPPGPEADPEGAGADYLRTVAGVYAGRLIDFARDAELIAAEHGREWDRAYDMSDWPLRLSAARAAALRQQIHDVMEQARLSPAEPGDRSVIVQLAILPVRGGQHRRA